MTDLEILKRWIQLEFILRDHDTFRGNVWTTAYKEQQRIQDSMWYLVFDEATSVSEWVNAYYKEQE